MCIYTYVLIDMYMYIYIYVCIYIYGSRRVPCVVLPDYRQASASSLFLRNSVIIRELSLEQQRYFLGPWHRWSRQTNRGALLERGVVTICKRCAPHIRWRRLQRNRKSTNPSTLMSPMKMKIWKWNNSQLGPNVKRSCLNKYFLELIQLKKTLMISSTTSQTQSFKLAWRNQLQKKH